MFSNMPEWHPNFLKKRRLRDDGSAFDYYHYYFKVPYTGDEPYTRFDSFKKMTKNDDVKDLAFCRCLNGCKLDFVRKFPFKLVYTSYIKLFLYSVYIRLIYNVYKLFR